MEYTFIWTYHRDIYTKVTTVCFISDQRIFKSDLMMIIEKEKWAGWKEGKRGKRKQREGMRVIKTGHYKGLTNYLCTHSFLVS